MNALWNKLLMIAGYGMGVARLIFLCLAIFGYKKELPAYGWEYGKISLKPQTVTFQKIQQEETL